MQFDYCGRDVFLQGVSESDWIYSIIRETGSFYELDLLKYIQYSMKGDPKGCVLDVGANIGNHSVFFGLFLAKKIVSFEPNPAVYKVLVENLKNSAIDYTAYSLGVGDKKIKAVIDLPENHVNNIGAAKLVEIRESQCINSETIDVTTLDEMLLDLERFSNGFPISAIKIDVEGMEPAVLRGAVTLLKKYKPDLFVEISSDEQMASVLKVVEPLGYKSIVDWAATPVWHFVHYSNLNIVRIIKLKMYIFVFKHARRYFSRLKSLVKRLAASVK